MKCYILLWMTLVACQGFGQSSICWGDSTHVGVLIGRLSHGDGIKVTLRSSYNANRTEAVRLCEEQYPLVDSLERLASREQIEGLMSCDNGALAAIGFVILCNRVGDKSLIIRELERLIEARPRFVVPGCSDVVQILSVGQFCLELLIQGRPPLKRKVLFTESELVRLKERITSKQSAELSVKCDLEVLLATSKKIGQLTELEVRSFLLTFGKECGSNAEYSEWSNELLFKVLNTQTKLVLKTMEGAESVIDVEAILADLSSPINDGIDMKKLLPKVDAVQMNSRLKRQIIRSLNEAVKRME